MEDIIRLVKEALSPDLNKPAEEIDDMEELEETIVERFLIREEVRLVEECRASLKTPWSLARYLILIKQDAEVTEKLENELKSIVPGHIEYYIRKNLSCLIEFTHKYVEGMKPQRLTIKYALDEESDTIQYKIWNGVTGWDITRAQLKSLLENKAI